MSQTVRLDARTHAALSALARAKKIPMTEALAKAVEMYRRSTFLHEIAASYAALSAQERKQEGDDIQLWDATLSDGDSP